MTRNTVHHIVQQKYIYPIIESNVAKTDKHLDSGGDEQEVVIITQLLNNPNSSGKTS